MEGLTLQGEQKGYIIGSILVWGVVWEAGKEREVGLTCKTSFVLIQSFKKENIKKTTPAPNVKILSKKRKKKWL